METLVEQLRNPAVVKYLGIKYGCLFAAMLLIAIIRYNPKMRKLERTTPPGEFMMMLSEYREKWKNMTTVKNYLFFLIISQVVGGVLHVGLLAVERPVFTFPHVQVQINNKILSLVVSLVVNFAVWVVELDGWAWTVVNTQLVGMSLFSWFWQIVLPPFSKPYKPVNIIGFVKGIKRHIEKQVEKNNKKVVGKNVVANRH